MHLQIEGTYKCFICNTIKENSKIIKNQDGNDAICKEDFIKLCTEDTNNYVSITNPEEAEILWNGIRRDGSLPCHNNP